MAASLEDRRLPQTNDDRPPIMKTWRRLYTAVLIALAAEVVLFVLVTRYFA